MLAKSERDRVNIAVIGCGNWGKNLIRVLAELNVLAGVCDPDYSKAKIYADKYNVPVYTQDEVLADKKINAVVIASPSITHFEIAELALSNGKHTFVEKPLALSVAHALTLNQLAKQNKLILMVGHLLHYHAGFIRIKELIQEGKLGKLQYIYSNRLNLGKFRTEENIWWDYAPHDVSMILALVGKLPNLILATGANYLQHTYADVTCTQLNFSDNIKAHIFVSWLHPYKEQKLVVVGEKGMVIFNDCEPWQSKLKFYPYPVSWVDGLPQPWEGKSESIELTESEPLSNECRHFIDCIINNKTPNTDGDEALRVIYTLNAAIESINTKQPIHMMFNGETQIRPCNPEKLTAKSSTSHNIEVVN